MTIEATTTATEAATLSQSELFRRYAERYLDPPARMGATLSTLVERTHSDRLRQEVERLEADLRLAKAEVKAARLEVRLLTARRAQAEGRRYE